MSQTRASPLFDINKCRAKMYGAGDLVDCLAQEQAPFCGYALPFGYGYFCKHPQSKKFAETTIKLQDRSATHPSSDIQE